jgi:hypothetical protein
MQNWASSLTVFKMGSSLSAPMYETVLHHSTIFRKLGGGFALFIKWYFST